MSAPLTNDAPSSPLAAPPAVGSVTVASPSVEDLPYVSVPFAPAGATTVRYSLGEELPPLSYPVDDE